MISAKQFRDKPVQEQLRIAQVLRTAIGENSVESRMLLHSCVLAILGGGYDDHLSEFAWSYLETKQAAKERREMLASK